ncbi:hypothetical protein AOLI_G00151000 [Acnodon oligacanthus]
MVYNWEMSYRNKTTVCGMLRKCHMSYVKFMRERSGLEDKSNGARNNSQHRAAQWLGSGTLWAEAMNLQSIKRFALELDGPGDAVYSSGEVVSGKVVLELRGELRLSGLLVLGRGAATAHWLENRSAGVNTAYSDYTSKVIYFRKKQRLIRGQ